MHISDSGEREREREARSVQDFTPRIHISEEDFGVMTRGGELLDDEGQLRIEAFEEVMRDQVPAASASPEGLCKATDTLLEFRSLSRLAADLQRRQVPKRRRVQGANEAAPRRGRRSRAKDALFARQLRQGAAVEAARPSGAGGLDAAVGARGSDSDGARRGKGRAP